MTPEVQAWLFFCASAAGAIAVLALATLLEADRP